MRLLLLGGIGEARVLARRVVQAGHDLTYSVAGRGRIPDGEAYAVRAGGFGGARGLAEFLAEGGYDGLIDATHPYAAEISTNAAVAAERAGVRLWAYRRPPWLPAAGDSWRTAADWPALVDALLPFRRVFFSIGREPLDHSDEIPPTQHWLVRCLPLAGRLPADAARLSVVEARAPFAVEGEIALMRRFETDVLVAKNSGGSAVAAKLDAARQLEIPVMMLRRPELPAVDKVYDDVEDLAGALRGEA